MTGSTEMALDKETIAAALDGSRSGRLLGLLDPLDDDVLNGQISPIMSPLVWDLADVGNYEELWLLHHAGGLPTTSAELDDLYNAFEHPRWQRPSLPILGPSDARRYIADVHAALEVLDKVPDGDLAPDGPNRLLPFVYAMVAQHEHQHIETILATLNMLDGDGYPPAHAGAEGAAPAHPLAPSTVEVAGGTVTIGTDDTTLAYDNERPAHTVEIAPFRIARDPVTNAEYAAFVDDGGYDDRHWWSPDGRAWLAESGATAPQDWHHDGSRWTMRSFGRREPVQAQLPVMHVSWFEADAYCRWAGGRLPSEPEWELAARGTDTPRSAPVLGGPPASHCEIDPCLGRLSPRTPPGATLSSVPQAPFSPAPVGSHPEATSEWGCRGMLGDVWEWTSTPFGPYPGFRAFPYPEYSEVFFGDGLMVLRGGSWATHPLAARTTFRNWDLPKRRQIFSGIRIAHDV